MLKYYVCWLLLMSAVTFFLMGWDKHLARCRRRRIPERVLLIKSIRIPKYKYIRWKSI